MREVVTVAGHDFACARIWGAECLRRVPRSPNPSGLAEPDRFFKHYLGELAWLRWCRAYGLRCRYFVKTEGRSVDPDSKFTLFVHDSLFARDVTQACRVKAAGFAWYKEFMLPVKQGVEQTALYVGMRVRCDADTDLDQVEEIDVECFGILPGLTVAALPIGTGGVYKVPTRHCLLTDLRPQGTVRDTFERGGLELLGRAVELQAPDPVIGL